MTGPLSRDLADVFAHFGPAFMHWMKQGFRDEPLTFARMRLLWALDMGGPMIMAELSDELAVSPRSVTSLVDGLEREGYVARRPHPDDRRAIIVELTIDGREAMSRLQDNHREIAAVMFDRLDEGDQADLLRIMGNLVGILHDLTEQGASHR